MMKTKRLLGYQHIQKSQNVEESSGILFQGKGHLNKRFQSDFLVWREWVTNVGFIYLLINYFPMAKDITPRIRIMMVTAITCSSSGCGWSSTTKTDHLWTWNDHAWTWNFAFLFLMVNDWLLSFHFIIFIIPINFKTFRFYLFIEKLLFERLF